MSCERLLPALLLLGLAGASGAVAQQLPETDLSRLEPQVQQRLGAARSALEAALGDEQLADSERAALLGSTGELFHANGVSDFAAACYERAAALAPDSFRWPYLSAVLAEEAGRFETAERLLRRALEIRPKDPHARFHLARVQIARGDTEAARQQLEALLDQPGLTAAVRADLARLAEARGAVEEAVEHYRAALEVQPEAAQLYFPLAALLRRLGRTEEARRTAELAVTGRRVSFADPIVSEVMSLAASSETYSRLAIQAIRSGDLAAATDAYRTALELRPDNERARMNLAVVELQRGNLEEAERLLRITLRNDPDYAHAHFNLAKVLQGSGRADEAEQHYLRAVNADPANTEFLFGYASLLVEQGEYQEATEQLTAVVERAPGFVRARYLLGLALEASGDRESARRALAEGHALAPEHGEIAAALARLTATLDSATREQREEALQIARSLFEQQESAEHAETLAMALAATGRFEPAVHLQAQLVEAVRRQGAQPELLGFLERNLELYRAAKPAVAPWPR